MELESLPFLQIHGNRWLSKVQVVDRPKERTLGIIR